MARKEKIFIDGIEHVQCSGIRQVRCGRILPHTEQYFGLVNRRGRARRKVTCKKCEADKAKLDRLNKPEGYHRNDSLKRNYGVTLE